MTSNTRVSTGSAGIVDLLKCSLLLIIMILLLWVLTIAFPPNSSKCFNIYDFIVTLSLVMRLFLDGETLIKV